MSEPHLLRELGPSDDWQVVGGRRSRSIGDAQIKELVELAQKRSPVFDIVTHETPVSVSVEMVESSREEQDVSHI